MNDNNQPYDYTQAGFSRFFRRAIDNPITPVANLQEYARLATQQARMINFDQQITGGSMGDVMQIGESIKLDGSKRQGRISIFDGQDEVVRVGDLDEA